MPSRTNKASKKGPSKNVRQAIVQVVKRQLSTASEKKLVSSSSENSSVTNGTRFTADITGFNEFYPMVPPVAQGLQVNQRVGNRISPSSCYLDITLAIDGGFPGSVAIQPRLFMVTDRGVSDYKNASGIAWGSLIEPGGNPQKYDGEHPNASMYPLNARQFIKHHDITFPLWKGNGEGATTVAAGQTVSELSHSMRRFRLKVPLPKHLKYDLEADVYPSNALPLLAIGFTTFTNTQEFSYIAPPLVVNWCLTMHYTDD